MTNTKRKKEKKMKERLRNIKGITLISLVITIIVLLILSAVAINLAVNTDGLFGKAGEAANKWNTTVAGEESAIQNIIEQVEEIGKVNPVSKYITQTSEVAGVTKERTVPIPKGYVASQIPEESTIAEGLVIYEGTAEVAGTKESAEHETAMTTRNQYVWIPVDDINDMVMCSVCGGASKNLVYDEDAKTLTCTSTHAEGKISKLVGKLYTRTSVSSTGSSPKIYKYTIDFTQSNQRYDPNSGNREPAIVTGNITGDGNSYDGATDNYHELESATAFLTQLQKDFEDMAKSVAKYKGFYISRYEVGANGTSKKGQPVLNASSSSANMWYGLYNTLRSDTNVEAATYSQMIWRKPV